MLGKRAAEHHGLENLVIFAHKKFWFCENRPFVRTSTRSCNPGLKFCISDTRVFGGKLHGHTEFSREKTTT